MVGDVAMLWNGMGMDMEEAMPAEKALICSWM